MDRREEVLEKCSKEIQLMVNKNTIEADDYFDRNREDIVQDFIKSMQLLCDYTNKAQEENGKKKVSFLCINSLYSSILTGTFDFIFSLKDSTIYLDNVETEIYWTPAFVFKNIDRDMIELTKIIKSKFIRVSDFEIDEIKYAYSLMHSGLALKYIFELAIGAREEKLFDSVDIEDNFEILFSLHMEKGRPIKL